MLIVQPGRWHDAVIAAFSASVGCVALAAGLYGYLRRSCAWWERIVLIAGALLLIKPGWVTDVIGFALLATILLYQSVGIRRPEAPPRSAAPS